MKKSIDHGRPSDVYGRWVMGKFRGEKNLTLDEKEGSALDDKGYLGVVPNIMEKRSLAVQRTEIEKIVESESAIMQVVEGRGMKTRPLNENTRQVSVCHNE
jgi:hypothetical protein